MEIHGFYLDDMEHNKEKRENSKGPLTNLWGKFGQRQHAKEYLLKPKEFVDALERHVQGETEIVGRPEPTHNNSHMHTMYPEDDDAGRYRRNVGIAAVTTAHGRTRPYKEVLSKLGKDSIFHDTDSGCYRYRPESGPHLELGSHLGNLEDEVPNDSILVGVVGLGPKCYAKRFVAEDFFDAFYEAYTNSPRLRSHGALS